ncbi:MAG: ATP synthase F0 subunit B [Candidatus Magnetoovum sp. WYHC-5]|nr:ATP synthase F0 subunit B [Candidatus Magnetoovum sp. WYHC-5]
MKSQRNFFINFNLRIKKAGMYGCVLAFAFLFNLIVAMPEALASSEGGHGASAKTWMWVTINFSILIFVLVYFLKKPLSDYLAKRAELIQKSLEEAKLAREYSQKAFVEIEERLKLKDEEIKRIINTATEYGEREKAKLVIEAKSLTDKIKELTDKNIAYELKKAKDDLRREAASVIIEMSEIKIKSVITESHQHKLIDNSIDKLRQRN